MKKLQGIVATLAFALALGAYVAPADAGCTAYVYVTNKTGQTITVHRVKTHKKKSVSLDISTKDKTINNGKKATFHTKLRTGKLKCGKAERRVRVYYTCASDTKKSLNVLTPYKKDQGRKLTWSVEIKSCN